MVYSTLSSPGVAGCVGRQPVQASAIDAPHDFAPPAQQQARASPGGWLVLFATDQWHCPSGTKAKAAYVCTCRLHLSAPPQTGWQAAAQVRMCNTQRGSSLHLVLRAPYQSITCCRQSQGALHVQGAGEHARPRRRRQPGGRPISTQPCQLARFCGHCCSCESFESVQQPAAMQACATLPLPAAVAPRPGAARRPAAAKRAAVVCQAQEVKKGALGVELGESARWPRSLARPEAAAPCSLPICVTGSQCKRWGEAGTLRRRPAAGDGVLHPAPPCKPPTINQRCLHA